MLEGGLAWVLGMLRFPAGEMARWLATETDPGRVESELEGLFPDATAPNAPTPTVRVALGNLKGRKKMGVALQPGQGRGGTDQLLVFGEPGRVPGATNMLPLVAAFMGAKELGGAGMLLCLTGASGGEGAPDDEDLPEEAEDDFVWIVGGPNHGPSFRLQGEEPPLPSLPLDEVVEVVGDAFDDRSGVAFLLREIGYPIEL